MKRNPIIAGCFSVLFTGLGQLYNGQPAKAILLLLLPYIMILLFGLIGMIESFYGMLAICVFYAAFLLIAFIDSIIWARRQNDYSLKPVNSWKYYIGFIVIWYFLIFSIPPFIKSALKYEALTVLTPSMEPTLMAGDKIMAVKIESNDIQIGDIITFTLGDGQKYVSRVMGLPEQSIAIEEDRVLIDGVSEIWDDLDIVVSSDYQYQVFASILPTGKVIGTQKMLKYRDVNVPEFDNSNMELMVIPREQFFVLGDNRNNTLDSRIYGAVRAENIEKKVHYIWWSDDKGRIGKNLNKE